LTGMVVARWRETCVSGGGGGMRLAPWSVFLSTSFWCVVAAYLAWIGVIGTEP
jgi:hypothetical protein